MSRVLSAIVNACALDFLQRLSSQETLTASATAIDSTRQGYFHAFTFGDFGDATAAGTTTLLRGDTERLGVTRFRGEGLCK